MRIIYKAQLSTHFRRVPFLNFVKRVLNNNVRIYIYIQRIVFVFLLLCRYSSGTYTIYNINILYPRHNSVFFSLSDIPIR